MKIKKISADAVKLHELTLVKLKSAGNISVVQFTAGNNKTYTVRNLSKDTYLDTRTGEIKQKKKSQSRYQSPKSVRKSINRLMDLIRCNATDSVLKPQNLMDELASSGVKYNPDDVIVVT